MASEQELVKHLTDMANDIGGFIAASVVDLDSGTHSMRPDFDLNVASAHNSEMVKQKLKIMQALKLNTNLEDMLLTLGDQIHLIKLLSDKSFLYVAADRANSNLAIVRSAVENHASSIKL